MRNSNIDIAKGIAIILMVMGHSSCPTELYKAIYSFHMPLFYILSGYFLNKDPLTDTRSFLLNKWKKLAIPLIICGIISVLLHNFFFRVGIINEFYGTRSGDVAYLFSAKDILIRIGLIIGALEVYDDPFLGAAWFIQSMFFAYVAISIIHYCFHRFSWDSQLKIGLCIFVFASLFLTTLHWCIPSIKTYFITRTAMAGVFIYLGTFLRNAIDAWKVQWWHLCLVALPIFSTIFIPITICMEEQINPLQFATLLITGTTGTLFIYGICKYISQHRVLSFIPQTLGRYSIYILFLHMLMFKPISYLFIKFYNLDPLWIGCRPTIYQIANSWHWIVYTVGSILLCMMIAFIRASSFHFWRQNSD